MRVSDYGKQHVHSRIFWMAILCVAVVLGGLGLYEMQTGNVPVFPSWISGVLLVFVWLAFLLRLIRYGRKSVSPKIALFMLSCSLCAGSDVVMHGGRSASLLKGVGSFLLVMLVLSEYICIGKPTSSAPRSESTIPPIQ